MMLKDSDWVRIPAGQFLMGDEGTLIPNRARMRATLTQSFRMMTCPVTQALWTEVMGTTPWDAVRQEEGVCVGPNFPAVGVTWHDARNFAKTLSQTSKLHLRLPTDCEWEYALRAGTATAYFWGEDDEGYAPYSHCESQRMQEVGRLQPNPWGLRDMPGNVREWVLDLCELGPDEVFMNAGHYPAEAINFLCTKGDVGIVRGAAFDDSRYGLFSTFKKPRSLNDPAGNLGFRLIQEDAPLYDLNSFQILRRKAAAMFQPIEYFWHYLDGNSRKTGLPLLVQYSTQIDIMRKSDLAAPEKKLLETMTSGESLNKVLEFIEIWEETEVMQRKHNLDIDIMSPDEESLYALTVTDLKRKAAEAK